MTTLFKQVTPESLINKYGYWGEHDEFPAEEWRELVVKKETRLGYWQWVANSLNDGTEDLGQL